MRTYGWPLVVGILILVGGVIFGVGGIFFLPLLGILVFIALLLWVAERRARDKPPVE